MAFDVALYTDVTAREAIDGIDGFNFQSISDGVTGVDQQRIREGLLHRVFPQWALEHDAIDHPESCAFVVHHGRFYLSRGRSTGATNSGRSGNQITQTVITSDPADFVPYRPAQLYGATEWTLAPADGKRSEPWVTPLVIRPDLEVEALQDMVLNDTWSRQALPHYLSMVAAAVDAEPTKLVLVHDELRVVMQWIALGTLFVDPDAARFLQFRALVEDPGRVNATLIGVSPLLARGGFGSANVLDLAKRSLPTNEPSESSRRWATWFLEQSAADALSAVEVARRWTPGLGTALANESAQVVALPGSAVRGESAWRAAMEATERLREAGLRDDVALYSDELCEAAFGYGPTGVDEFALAGRAIRAAHDLGLDDLASGFLVPTLEALTVAPDCTAALASEIATSSHQVQWSSIESRDAASGFVSHLVSSASAERLPALLTMARVIATPVAEEPLSDAVRLLAEAWANDPTVGRDGWSKWVAGKDVLRFALDRLVASLNEGDSKALSALLDGAWDFARAEDESSSLQGWMRAARIARLPPHERADQIVVSAGVSPGAWRVVLAGTSVPGECGLWAAWITYHGLPADMAAELKATIADVLSSAPDPEVTQLAGDWWPLMKCLSSAGDNELEALASEYAHARSAIRLAAEQINARSTVNLSSCAAAIGRLTPLFLSEIGWLLLNTSDSAEVDKILNASSPWGSEAIRLSLIELSSTRLALRAVDYGLVLRSDPDTTVASAAERALSSMFAADPTLIERAKLQPALRRGIDKYLREQSRGRPTHRGVRGSFGRGKER